MKTLQMGFLCMALISLSTGLVCPDGSMCEDTNTCCKNIEGGYGCCPLPNAVCCSDHLHCCFEGTVCDLVHAKCVNKTVSLPWMKRLPTKSVEETVKAVLCPDKESECPDDTTCCQLSDTTWGCCPLAKAVCCEDKRHCCPEGTQCDLVHSKCTSSTSESFPMFKKLPAKRKQKTPDSLVGSVTCPGGKSCPDSYMCCLLASGDYGCCPYPNAMCCSDHLHCCPSNTICDLVEGVCRSDKTLLPLLKKIAAVPSNMNSVPCNGSVACEDGNTCCKSSTGEWACCPFAEAVCCEDHLHCCPHGTICNLKASTCDSTTGNPVRPLVGKLPVFNLKMDDTKCDNTTSCAGESTCCKTTSGDWSCCPLPEAVCCEDHLHCCPHGTICNLKASTCDSTTGNPVRPLVGKLPVFNLKTDDTKCDNTTSCAGESTCCKTTSGDWSCCPLPEAVCCDDHIHCCPHDTVCNLAAQSCDDPSMFMPSLPWVEKMSALTSKAEDEKCDQQTMCQGGTTCCKKSSGQWACCPLPQAVCCNDHEHCCPNGYKCNVAEQTCDKPGDLSLPWVQKIAALQKVTIQTTSSWSHPARIMCDPHTSCPRDTTCCLMNTHKWGCCPLPEAICCNDGNHCCPRGHTCVPHRSSCSKGPHVIPWFTKLSALTETDSVADVKCDDKSSCATGTTCCRLPTGAWGCCPLVKAVCCDDHEHCCPQSYICNMQTGSCEKKSNSALAFSVPQHKVEPSNRRNIEGDTDVPCDGTGDFRCPKQDTCCRTSATEWACCPSSRAVCCADLKHCCPAGFSCDGTAGGCIQQAQLTWDYFFQDRRKDFVPHGL